MNYVENSDYEGYLASLILGILLLIVFVGIMSVFIFQIDFEGDKIVGISVRKNFKERIKMEICSTRVSKGEIKDKLELKMALVV